MTVDQLRQVHQARPFRPFTVHVADGRSFRVEHPDFFSRSPSGRTIVVHGQEDRFDILDLLLVTGIEVHPDKSSSETAA